MDGFVKGPCAGHSSICWKGSYLLIETGEKLSEKVLLDVCIPLRDLYLFSHKAVFEHCSCKTETVIFCAHWRLWQKVKYPEKKKKTQKEVFHETALWRVHSFQRVKIYSTLSLLVALSLRNLWRDIKWFPWACGEKGKSTDEICRESLRSTALWCL